MGLLASLLWFFRSLIDRLIDYGYGWYFNKDRQCLPKLRTQLVLQSATSLATQIKNGKLTSQEVVQAYIDRINDVNPVINAVVDKRFALALQEAKDVDEKLKNGEYTEEELQNKPFLGVPFTTKESTACKGLKWTFGLVSRKYVVAEDDAEIIRLMKNAGGILLGVTNIPQLNLWVESYNPIYGRTNNPYNTTRNVGGSSGGEAAILAAAGSAIGIGTDIGGSIRIPAFLNGIFGHKPTCDLISTRGMTFRTGDEGSTMTVAGPMARHSEDLMPLLKVLLNKNVDKLNLDKKVDKVKVFYCPEFDDILPQRQTEEMVALMDRVVENLKDKSSITPKKVKFDIMQYASKLYSVHLVNEPNFNFNRDITNKKGHLSLLDCAIKVFSLSGEYSLYVLFVIASFLVPKKPLDWVLEQTDKLKGEIIDMLGEDGVLVFPSGAFPANYHYTSMFRPYNVTYTSIWNVLRMPVTQVPLGLSKDGLPVGIQIVAAPYQDHLCLEVARYLEEKMGGYVPPSPLEEK